MEEQLLISMRMNGMESNTSIVGTECDPDTFYPPSISAKERPFNPNWIFDWLIVFNWIHAPFLIIMPHWMNHLKTNTRKVIAMIVTSDVLSSIIILAREYTGFSRSPWFCFCLTQFFSITRSWSQIWSFLLILNVFLVLSPKLGLKGSSPKFMTLCHVIAWPYAVLLAYFASGVPPFEVRELKNALVIPGCWGNLTFYVNENHRCVVSTKGRYMWMSYLIIILSLTLIALVLSLVTVQFAYATWKKNLKEAVEKHLPGSVMGKYEDGFEVAVNNSRTVLKTTSRLALTAFIYIFTVIPLVGANIYHVYYGHISSKALRNFLNTYPPLSIVMIGTMNIISYLYLSPFFRQEVWKLLTRWYQWCCKRRGDDIEATTDTALTADTLGTSLPYTHHSANRQSDIFKQRASHSEEVF